MANTDFRAMMQKRAEDAAHDPLHRHFSWSLGAVVSRVDLGDTSNRCEMALDKITGALHTHIRNHINTHQKNLDIQQAVERIMDDKHKVLRSALASLNSYYLKPTRATVEQFKEGIDNHLVTLGMPKLFDSKKETTPA
jgi:hypothetical protein